MAVVSNSSNDAVASGGVQLFSGIGTFKVLAVNPDLQALEKIGVNLRSEPSYEVSLGGQDFNKVVFWVGNDDLTTRLEFLLAPEERVSRSGKHQYMNNIGQSTWADGEPTYEWWQNEGTRKAYIGEETLINFVKAWANVASGDSVYFDDMKAIANGDVKEVRELAKVLKDNEVRLLVGVKDGKYQVVYTKYFGRVTPQRDDLFIKELSDDYGAFKAEFDNTLSWGPFVPSLAVPTPNVSNSEEEDDEEEDWA